MSIITQRSRSALMKTGCPPGDQQFFTAPDSSDQFPRYHPVELPIAFNVWPPTPKNIGNNKYLSVREPSFAYSLPEDHLINGSSWGANDLGIPDSRSLDPHTIAIAQQFDSPIDDTYIEQFYCSKSKANLTRVEGDTWDKTRNDYLNVLRGLTADRKQLRSSCSSADNADNFNTSRHFQTQAGFDSDPFSVNTRRVSNASTSASSNQELLVSTSDQGFDDISQHYDRSSLSPEYTHRVPICCAPSISPAISPRQTAVVSLKSGSRGKNPPPQRPTLRVSPYSFDSSRSERWSASPYSSTRKENISWFEGHGQIENLIDYSRSRQDSSASSINAYSPSSHSQLSHLSNHLLLFNGNDLLGGGMRGPCMDNMAASMAHPLFMGIFAPNINSYHNAYLSDPPDLYSSLRSEQIPPPPEDMNPEDPDMKPHEQELRFEGDLYTPRWVRNYGNKREGWCGLCKPGRWLVLKNSAFWYDKCFAHGICAATGQQFVEPKEIRRMDGNPDVWEGLCHSCNEWVALVSNKKKGTTWFRHAYKCHSHSKIKDAAKRRRESSQNQITSTPTGSAETGNLPES